MHFPWRIDRSLLDAVGHGSYDLNNYNERLAGGKVTLEQLRDLFDSLMASPYWIPTFPVEYRESYGIIISAVLILLLVVLLIVGGINRAAGVLGVFVCLGTLLVAFLAGRILSYFIHQRLEESHLKAREAAFADICSDWNRRHSQLGVTADPGRFGAYIRLQFNHSLEEFGKYLMFMIRQKELAEQKEAKQRKMKAETISQNDY